MHSPLFLPAHPKPFGCKNPDPPRKPPIDTLPLGAINRTAAPLPFHTIACCKSILARAIPTYSQMRQTRHKPNGLRSPAPTPQKNKTVEERISQTKVPSVTTENRSLLLYAKLSFP